MKVVRVGIVMWIIASASYGFTYSHVWSDMFSFASHILSNKPHSHSALSVYGNHLMTNKDYKGAISYFRTSLEYEPNNLETRNNLAICLALIGKTEEGIFHLKELVRTGLYRPHILVNLGDLLTSIGRAGEAVPYLEKALLENDRIAEAHFQLGQAYRALGKTAKADAEMKRALQLNPELEKLTQPILPKGRAPE